MFIRRRLSGKDLHNTSSLKMVIDPSHKKVLHTSENIEK